MIELSIHRILKIIWRTGTYMQHVIRLNLQIGMQYSQHIRYSAPHHHLTDNCMDRNCDMFDEHQSRDHGPTGEKKKKEKKKIGFRRLYDVFVSF